MRGGERAGKNRHRGRRSERAEPVLTGPWFEGRPDHLPPPPKSVSRHHHDDEQVVVDEVDGWEWDEVVDIVCAGSGRLAGVMALVAERAGLAHASVDLPDGARQLALGLEDQETAEYLSALGEDFPPSQPTDPVVVVRQVDGPLPRRLPTKRIATFDGAALRDWGASCVSSPHGLLYTRIADHNLWELYTSDAGPIEVAVLDTVDVDADRPGDGLRQWLSTLDDSEDGDAPSWGTVTRLLFHHGAVVGAALESADGPITVRARHGVMIALGDGSASSEFDIEAADLKAHQTAQVALVSCAASRFGRLELLTRDAP